MAEKAAEAAPSIETFTSTLLHGAKTAKLRLKEDCDELTAYLAASQLSNDLQLQLVRMPPSTTRTQLLRFIQNSLNNFQDTFVDVPAGSHGDSEVPDPPVKVSGKAQFLAALAGAVKAKKTSVALLMTSWIDNFVARVIKLRDQYATELTGPLNQRILDISLEISDLQAKLGSGPNLNDPLVQALKDEQKQLADIVSRVNNAKIVNPDTEKASEATTGLEAGV